MLSLDCEEKKKKTGFHLYYGRENTKLRLAWVVCVGGGGGLGLTIMSP